MQSSQSISLSKQFYGSISKELILGMSNIDKKLYTDDIILNSDNNLEKYLNDESHYFCKKCYEFPSISFKSLKNE